MKLTYIGHACFLMETSGGTRIIFDPFQPLTFGGRIRLAPYHGPVDAVVSSHAHLDHRHIDPSFGAPQLILAPGQVKGVILGCVDLPHGAPEGRDHGTVRAFSAVADGLRVVHLGDAGRAPDLAEMKALGHPDVLLVPTGGRFTMGPAEAAGLVRAWRPGIAVPMHFADPDVDIVLRPVSEFTDLIEEWSEHGETLELDAGDLGGPPRVLVMQHRPSR